MELLTAAQMRALETAAIERGEVTGLELMERAGEGVVEAILEEWPELVGSMPGEAPGHEYLDKDEERRALVLCGPGNNGGDGFVVARLLRERGWDVEVFLYGDPAKLPRDARANYARWLEIGEVHESPALAGEDQMNTLRAVLMTGIELLAVDAMFGTGLARPLAHNLTAFDVVMRNMVSHPTIRRVAVDVPSGLCADSGRQLGDAYRAELTVTFHGMKAGHVLGCGPDVCGRVVTKSIGITEQAGPFDPPIVEGNDGCELRGLGKSGARHKYGHGHALVLSGGFGRTGAARLAARGALRVGAGLVTLGVPGVAQVEVASQITALMMRRVDGAEELGTVLGDVRINAMCLGPGLGMERARELVPVALGRGGVKPRPTVLDADALAVFADAPQDLFEMLHEDCVLTPHGGEFARLFPDIAERLAAPPTRGPAFSKVDATREAAARAGCVVLFKGPDTVIAAPDGRCSIHAAVYERAAPWLATAGSGDVLAGMITGLLARGHVPMQAAETAAWLHVEAARAFGAGLIAEDLPETLPEVLQRLGS